MKKVLTIFFSQYSPINKSRESVIEVSNWLAERKITAWGNHYSIYGIYIEEEDYLALKLKFGI